MFGQHIKQSNELIITGVNLVQQTHHCCWTAVCYRPLADPRPAWRHTFSRNCFPVPEEPSDQSDKGTTILHIKRAVNNQRNLRFDSRGKCDRNSCALLDHEPHQWPRYKELQCFTEWTRRALKRAGHFTRGTS